MLCLDIIKVGLPELLRGLPIAKVREYSPGIIVAVERGGLAPAALISFFTGIPMISVRSRLYDDGKPARKLSEAPEIDLRGAQFGGKRVLVVDDVSNSGATLDAVRRAVIASGATDAKTYAVYGKSDFSSRPFSGCVKFPWEA